MAKTGTHSLDADVKEVLADLKKLGNRKTRDEMGPKYGIHTDPDKVFGVPVGKIKQYAKQVPAGGEADARGKNHELALALWETRWYEARMLCSYIDDPARVTAKQMDQWCKDFDNWGIVDTICFHLFDRIEPRIAFGRVKAWAKRKAEFEKRAAFALLGCLALHNKVVDDAMFMKQLPLIEKAADDERNFVKKGVSWALRCIGCRGPALHAAAVELSQRLTESPHVSAKWIGREALRELGKRKPAKSSREKSAKTTRKRT